MPHIIDTSLLDTMIVGRVNPYIYAFSTETVPNYLKVGDTYRPVSTRLTEWRQYYPNLIQRYSHTAMLDRLIIENNLQDNIHELGLQKNPYKYIYYSDCFVLSSRYEGLPNVLIESTYLEKQAVAFKCIPIIEEIIIDHINGLCVEPENVDKLAEAMIQIQSMNLNCASPYNPSSAEDFYSIFS